jgi:predicted TIM-barrel fold metal-dependent hydrolase
MEIIDAQIHHPEPAKPWPGHHPGAAFDVELAIAAMDAVGVDAALVHSDRAFCDAAYTRYPHRFAGVVQFREPLTIEDPEAELEALAESPGIVGFRLMPGWPPHSPDNLMEALRAGRLDTFFAAGERHGLTLALFAPEQLRDVPAVARAHPSLRIVIDHIGMLVPPQVPFSDRLLDTLPDLLALAEFPNIAIKFSRVPGLSTETYPFSDMWRRAGHQIIEAFTPERLMWGSDYTRLQGFRTYAEIVAFLLYADEVSDADRETMFSRSARNWFNWEVTHAESAES